MKTITLDDVVSALLRFDSLEADDFGHWWYYLHLDTDTLEFVPNMSKNTVDFQASAPFVDFFEEECNQQAEDEEAATDAFWGGVYDLETKENSFFMEAAQELWCAVIDYVEGVQNG